MSPVGKSAREVLSDLLSKSAETDLGKDVLSQEVRNRLLDFYDRVRIENEAQNLTRLIEPQDFFEGHIEDVLHLLRLDAQGWIDYPAMDLGSGIGVPGLLAALMSKATMDCRWVLAEAELRKAEYLRKMVDAFELNARVSVFHGRAEDYLKVAEIGSIVVRAVGPISRIYTWVMNCSTWHNLILLKGPKWQEEWQEFHLRYKHKLHVDCEYSYQTGSIKKSRKMIKLGRLSQAEK